MLWLSDEAIEIEYAVSKCRSERGYKVGIALNSRAKYKEVELCIRRCLRDTDDFKLRRSTNNMEIEFHNGSYIKVIPASDNSRGYRYHLLILDEYISDEVLNCVLRHCEIPESIERQRYRRYNSDVFEKEYICNWVMSADNADNDKDYADVSEDEFMEILNKGNRRDQR